MTTTRGSARTLKASKPLSALSLKSSRTRITKPSKKESSKFPSSNAALIASSTTAQTAPLSHVASPSATNTHSLPPAAIAIATGSPSTTTLLQEAQAHLIAAAPKIAPLIEQHDCPLFKPEWLAEVVDPFESLASAMISQQVSGAAAMSIKVRLVALFSSQLAQEGLVFPTPAMILPVPHAVLRTAGLSERKAEYIHSLAAAFNSGMVSSDFFASASDAEIIERLTLIRGIGVWSAEMFLLFGLRRLDVFSTGDLGIQRGMAAFAGKDVKALKRGGKRRWKYMSEEEMLKQSEKFKPYRTLFCWYMWRCEGTDIDAMGDSKPKPKAPKK